MTVKWTKVRKKWRIWCWSPAVKWPDERKGQHVEGGLLNTPSESFGLIRTANTIKPGHYKHLPRESRQQLQGGAEDEDLKSNDHVIRSVPLSTSQIPDLIKPSSCTTSCLTTCIKNCNRATAPWSSEAGVAAQISSVLYLSSITPQQNKTWIKWNKMPA